MTSAEIFIRNAALDLGKVASDIAYTVMALDDYQPELERAKKCIEEVEFYVRERRKEVAKEAAKRL